jgi:3-oxoacyl-[acyl-carrier-protein] synthase-3
MPDNAVYITKCAAFLPNAPVSNDQMESLLGQVGERPSRARKMILRSNQIRTRYYAIDPETGEHNYSNAQLAAEAIRRLDDSQFSVNDIECLACSTTIADQIMPNHAVMVHGELGNPACEVVSTAGVCVCGMSALKYAYMSVLAGVHASAVAAASEASSYSMRAENFSEEIQHKVEQLESNPEIAFEKDFLRWMLSDGAGAVLLEKRPRAGQTALRIEWIDIFSYANEMDACMYAGARKNADGSLTGWQRVSAQERSADSYLAVKQDVKLLNEHVIFYTAEKPLAELRKKRGLEADQIDYFLPHYSSGYFRDRLHAGIKRAGFDIPQERWFSNLGDKGNTGSASIYIMLEEIFNSGTLKAGEKILCYVPESGRFSTAFMLLTVV